MIHRNLHLRQDLKADIRCLWLLHSHAKRNGQPDAAKRLGKRIKAAQNMLRALDGTGEHPGPWRRVIA